MGDFTGEELIQAAIFNDAELMKCLLEGECAKLINFQDRRGRTAVYTSVSNNSLRCLRVLLEHGADPNIAAGETFNSMTPLHCAIIDLKLDIFKLLLSHGADFTKQDGSGLTPKTVAENMELDEYVEEMEEEQERREQIFDSVLKAFAEACKAEDVSRMADILECNSSPTIHVKLVSNAVTDDGLTPLCWACKCGNISMLQLLLQHEASIISCTSQDMTPIHLACHFEHSDCVQLLLQYCPDIVQRKMANDSLALHVAVEVENLSLVTLLLTYDYPEYALEDFKEEGMGISYKLPFDVNAKDSIGRSPLFLAAEKNNPDIVRCLLNFGVQFEKKQRRYEGRSRLTSDVSFEPELRKEQFGSSSNSGPFSSNVYHPVDINLQGRNGFTPLHMAVSNSYYEVTDILLKHKADVNILANDSGKLISTLMMACRRGDSIILDKLFKYGADDLDKQVFTYAVEKRPKMVFTLLKYRTCKDVENEYKINRMDMKNLYRKMSEIEDSYDGLISLNLNFRKKFPVHPVHVKWQDLQHIEMVKEDMLIDISCHHNPEIQTTSLNYPFALFAITKIDISGNKIGSVFPSVFFKLHSLHYLNLSKNQIKTFPDVTNTDDIFVCLEELLLDKNKIEVLPDYLFSVSTLRYLSVAHNSLREFSSELWDMQCLAYLNLSDNQIASLPQPRPKHSRPPSQGNPSSITSSYPEIHIPPTLVTPTKPSVEELEVKHAVTWMSGKVVVMDSDFDSSSGPSNRGLQDLNLSKNRLTEIPFWLCCTSPYMENLNLSGNKIQSVGGLFQLPQYLKTLDLSGNNILDTVPWQSSEDNDGLCYNTRSVRPTGSPHSFNSYTSFTQLLTCGHRQHRILERLDTLNLGFNRRLEKIVITRLIEDRQGRNSTASLSSLNSSIDEEKRRLLFPNLTSLDISYNTCLKEIPPEIGDISALKRLSLSFTGIKELPPNIGKLKSLFTLELEKCNLEGPILDIIQGSHKRTKDILGFLLSILEEAEEYNCMNLMFVGVHNIGKTMLLREIRKYGKTTQKITHFSQRIDQSATGIRQDGGTLSTVGIDINEIVIGEKWSKGPVTFRTWDFGGQKEYYATHQYFLSPRSLYLVMWKLIDGEEGIQTIWQWLVSIQARAPGSPVIIIGTHRDILTARRTRNNFPASFEEDMKEIIERQFIKVEEPDKCGLPVVIGQINVSCKTGENVKDLVNFIYNRVFQLKHPRRNKEKLLQHKIPKKYLILKDIVQELAEERIREKKDPVLDKSSYMLKTMNKMMERSGTLFRDPEDVEQATRFLHENGILFHYEDLTLKDRYFLNPQWLCDQLARVVTVDQVNNFTQNGVMKATNLHVLFKQSSFQPENIEHYICGLLSKFELALEFDQQHLLIPSLLPREQDMHNCIRKSEDVKIPLQDDTFRRPHSGSFSIGSPNTSVSQRPAPLAFVNSHPSSNVIFSHCRLYVMTYFPSGFWPRLITRILADRSMYDIVKELFPIPCDILDACPYLKQKEPCWQLWQTGIQLLHHKAVLFRIKEVLPGLTGFCDYQRTELKCWIENRWSHIDMQNSVILEMGFCCDSIEFTFADRSSSQHGMCAITKKEQVFMDEKACAKFLVKISEHVDNLLQDWYPEIGESRFVQNCYGRYLITRVIPCPHCLFEVVKEEKKNDTTLFWQCVDQNLDVTSTVSLSDIERSETSLSERERQNGMYCFLVEKCILNCLNDHNEICPSHGSMSPRFMMSVEGIARTLYIAPDIVFNDLDTSILIGPADNLTLVKLIGKGAFGEVYQGKLRRVDEPLEDVAVKMLCGPFKDIALQPKGQSDLHMENATSAYLTARQEISILQTIQHQNIVPLLGLAMRPLSLVLSLAPQGSLGNKLLQIGQEGKRLSVYAIKQIVLQVVDALSYLHSRSIIYRDLKADNVLVWKMNGFDFSEDSLDPIHIRLADYGVSRTVQSSGTKGFGGTPPFIAPEILQFAGKAQYTEKVDIFSFGMFMYELLTCKKPLEDMTNPTLFVCQNGRPSITRRELNYPSHFLDLMSVSWSHDPTERPSAEQIKQIVQCPQFCHLADAISMDTSVNILSGCCVTVEREAQNDEDEAYDDDDILPNNAMKEIWLSTAPTNNNSRIEIYSFDRYFRSTVNKTIPLKGGEFYGLIAVDGNVFCVDPYCVVHIYSATPTKKIRLIDPDIGLKVRYLTSYVLEGEGSKKVSFVLASVRGGVLVILEVDLKNFEISRRKENVSGKCICGCLVPRDERRLEFWCGQTEGRILVLDYYDMKKDGEILEHFKIININRNCHFLESAAVEEKQFVWTYNYPGTTVYRWDVETRKVEAELNCADVVPITESGLFHAYYTNNHEARRCQVTAMKVSGKYLYIGTTSGCVIVADAVELKPFTVFYCHNNEDFYIRAIIPLQENSPSDPPHLKPFRPHGIVTVGKGYQDLILKTETETDPSFIQTIANRPSGFPRKSTKSPTYIISWYAKNWEFY